MQCQRGGKKRAWHPSIMRPTFCIMSFCLHGLQQALRCNLHGVSPALLRALELTDNICTTFWLFGERENTQHPGAVWFGYIGREAEGAEEANQASQQWWLDIQKIRSHYSHFFFPQKKECKNVDSLRCCVRFKFNIILFVSTTLPPNPL